MKDDGHFYAESIHDLATIQIQNWYVFWKIMCASVQSWVQRQRIWRDYIPLKSWYHEKRISPARATNKRIALLWKNEQPGKPCANPTKVQPPCERRKQAKFDKATIPGKLHLHKEDQSFLWKKDRGYLFRHHRNTTIVRSRFRREHRPSRCARADLERQHVMMWHMTNERET